MSAMDEESVLHPLERITGWVSGRDEAEIPVTEFFGQGPDLMDMTEVEFREWVNEGVALRMLTLGGLTSVMKVRPETLVNYPLPQLPRQQFSY